MKKKSACLFFLVLAIMLVLAGCSPEESSEAESECLKYDTNEAKNSCYTYWASLKKDSSICSLSPLRDSCYGAMMEETGDAAACRRMSTQETADDCYYKAAISKKDSSLCQNVADSRKNFCYFNAAQVTR